MNLLKEYKEHLFEIDREYVGDNRVKDGKNFPYTDSGKFYEDGVSQLNEVPTKEIMFNKLFSNVEYEVPYLDLGAVKDDKIRSKATKLDALVNGNRAFEYKKTHVLYNNGSYNEYSLKTLLSSLAVENFVNPNDGRSIASTSVVGDIEKLLLLPEKYEKNILFELWYGGGYSSKSYLKMLDTLLNNYYVVVEKVITYEDSIHPILDYCDIVHYKIIEKK